MRQGEEGGEGGTGGRWEKSWRLQEMARSKITFTMETVKNNVKEAVYVDTERRAFWSVKSSDTFNSYYVMYSPIT